MYMRFFMSISRYGVSDSELNVVQVLTVAYLKRETGDIYTYCRAAGATDTQK